MTYADELKHETPETEKCKNWYEWGDSYYNHCVCHKVLEGYQKALDDVLEIIEIEKAFEVINIEEGKLRNLRAIDFKNIIRKKIEELR